MKNLIILLSSIMLLFSCSSIYFEEPQPKDAKNLTEIPKDLIGEYSFIVLNSEKNVKITKDMFFSDDTTSLSDENVILRKIENYYVFNKKITDKDSTVNGKWELYLLKPNDCGNIKSIMFGILSNDDNKSIISDFIEKYKPESINPTCKCHFVNH